MNIEKKIKTWTDEECLTNFSHFLDRITLTTELIQNEEGLVVAEVIHAHCGKMTLTSAPEPLMWPLQPAPFPAELKAQTN